jgi:hypothetical protein
MWVSTIKVLVPTFATGTDIFSIMRQVVKNQCPPKSIPLRLSVVNSDEAGYHCEVETMHDVTDPNLLAIPSIFDFQLRNQERNHAFNAVMLIPTGIDCAIGGHAGDATVAAQLLASICDSLILHPNVVNASDINELPENSLYVEGSIICRLMMGTVGLQKVRQNRLLMVTENHDKGVLNDVINCVSGARATLGINSERVVVLNEGPSMIMSTSDSGRITGRLEQFDSLFEMLNTYRDSYDAVALSTKIIAPNVDIEQQLQAYYESDDAPNPWGGVEAMLTHMISTIFNVPSAHAPMLESTELLMYDAGIVDSRKAAEDISMTFLFCVLKGLNHAPGIVSPSPKYYDPSIITVEDISCLVIPDGVIGLPTLAALKQGIPVIAVRQNTNLMKNDLRTLPFRQDKLFIVDNYFEAAGVMAALKAGLCLNALNRPMAHTQVEYL